MSDERKVARAAGTSPLLAAGVAGAALGTAILLTRKGPGPPPPPPPGGGKPPIRGLLQFGVPPPALRSSLAGYVINTDWATLQPTASGGLAPGNPIEQAAYELDAYNQAHPEHPQVGKVRIHTGGRAPAWLGAQAGPCFNVTDTVDNKTVCCYPFWTDGYEQAYLALRAEALRYMDPIDHLPELVICRNMTVYAEPFLRQFNDPTTLGNYHRLGYSSALDKQQQLADVASWPSTRTILGWAHNPYQALDAAGNPITDEAFTESFMAAGRAALGDLFSVENDSLRSTFLPPGPQGYYPRMYLAMQKLGGPIGFQTAIPQRVGDLVTTLRGAAAIGATHVELPHQWETLITPAQAAAWPHL